MTEGEVLAIFVTAGVSMVVGVFGKILFDWLKNNRNGNGNGNAAWKGVDGKHLAQTVYGISETVKTVMDVQCKTDADGVPLVYMPRGFSNLMEKVSGSVTELGWNIKQNTKAIEKSMEQMQRLATAIEKRNGG